MVDLVCTVVCTAFIYGAANFWKNCLPSHGYCPAVVSFIARLCKNHSTATETIIFISFWKTQNSLRFDEYDIKQRKEKSWEEYISRIHQMACDDNISDLMLINFTAQGFKPEIAEKVIVRDPETFEDLFRFARRAESAIKFRKSDPVIASIEGWKTG